MTPYFRTQLGLVPLPAKPPKPHIKRVALPRYGTYVWGVHHHRGTRKPVLLTNALDRAFNFAKELHP